jgi:hypothetical protein
VAAQSASVRDGEKAWCSASHFWVCLTLS